MAEQANLDSFVGVKAGMTRIFDEQGNHVPVTVISLIPNYIVQVKTQENDGYKAYKIGFNAKKEKRVNKPTQGNSKKAGISDLVTKFYEVRAADVKPELVGSKLEISNFAPGTYIDVTSTSKGKGFQGVIKRYHFAGGPASHGSTFHRAPGSIGQRATPARVYAQKKMPGHMGDKKVTVQNLTVVEINLEKNYMLIKGSVPGSGNSFVRISKAQKGQE